MGYRTSWKGINGLPSRLIPVTTFEIDARVLTFNASFRVGMLELLEQLVWPIQESKPTHKRSITWCGSNYSEQTRHAHHSVAKLGDFPQDSRILRHNSEQCTRSA